MKYADYTHFISGEPGYYVTDKMDTSKIIYLGDLIENEFPGIRVEKYCDGQGSCATIGPEQSVCDEIDEWVSNNWTAAL